MLYPEIAPTPPGKIRLAECGSIDAKKYPSTRKTLNECGKYRLVHKTRGYELAGSCLRWTEESFGVLWDEARNQTTHGQWFKMLYEAQKDFERRTQTKLNNA